MKRMMEACGGAEGGCLSASRRGSDGARWPTSFEVGVETVVDGARGLYRNYLGQ